MNAIINVVVVIYQLIIRRIETAVNNYNEV
jgi:hypothetical protein